MNKEPYKFHIPKPGGKYQINAGGMKKGGINLPPTNERPPAPPPQPPAQPKK